MEEFIRNEFANLSYYRSKIKLNLSLQSSHNQSEIDNYNNNLNSKIVVIESWLELLNADEKFVIENHLIKEYEWARVAFLFSEQWKNEFYRTERTLVHYQATALKKIEQFCLENIDSILCVFGKNILTHK